ncbi:MAG: glycosyltransferase family 2 protein [Kiritimatiellales bacterium]|nr:glycosyltransferase family 2 protein [Kiritimatiellota bacterium]MBL7012663.1 glycosyltransferase family 2 protein [Kiritimatiellales bacterium]
MSTSIIIPFYNEEESVRFVLEEVLACQPHAEIIAVDDGSADRTWDIICTLPVHGLRLTENRGQSAAMYAGMRAASGDVIVLMDGDGQNDPADIQKLVALLQQENLDVVCGQRVNRRDTRSRRVASKAANAIRRSILNDGISDTGCSLKAFRREHVELLVPFNGLHRYLPAIFKQANLRIAETPVNHRERAQGTSKYTNWERALRGIYDLFGVRWLLKRKIVYPKLETHDES